MPGISNDTVAEPDKAVSGELARLRRQIATLSGRPDQRSVALADRSADVIPVPEALSSLLPFGGIVRGGVVAVTGAQSMVLGLIATASRAGQVGIVGMPRLNLLVAAEMGAELSRIATVPDPGADPVEVAAVLLDGMDLVVLDLRGAPVTPSRSRVVMGRVRKQGSALVVVGDSWPGAQTRIDTRVRAYRHLPAQEAETDLAAARHGHGRIGGWCLRVQVSGRGHQRESADIDVVPGGFGADGRVAMVHSAVRPIELAVAN